ncbi:MAG: response regulator, partial [Bacteroides sp.]
VFNTICEVSPGTLLASGHYAILYKIDKKSMNATPISYKTCHLYSSKRNEEISTLHKDTQGDIWMGGNRYMGKLNLRTSCVEAYPGINYINTIIDKDKSHLWIGTNHGIYVFNKNEGRFVKLTLPTPSASINTIYQSNHHLLYIGTTNSGLFIYNPTKKSFKHYHQDNSGLSSNCIYHFIPFGSRDLIISTQNSIALFSVGSQTFSSWTNKEGLPNIHFLPTSGTHTQQNSFVVGSEDGAIEFKHIKLPKNRKQALIFRDFKILYKEMDSNDEGSPLINDVNRTGTLKLKNSQNSFSMQVSAFYYAFSHRYHYRWKLYGYDESYITSDRNIIQYENIPTGHYKLIVEAISKETRQVVEKKEVSILILPSFWYSYKGITLCLLILGLVSLMTYYIYIQKKQIEKATEKIDFFVNTVHDIRTPLTLIKAPLEEFISRRSRTKKEENDLSIAVKNTNYLCKLISGISNFETEKISPRINMAEHELYSFLEEKVKQFDSLSTHKHINLSFRSNFRYLNVWFDIDKMESIIVNLLSNAIKYTTSYGTVEVIATQEQYCWKIEVKDSGIGIPNSEQNKLFKTFFRGKNAVQSQEPGSGMGLMMTGKLIHQQKGTIKINSIEGKGSSFEISFPFNSKQLEKNKGKQIKKEENPLIIINAQQACANVAKEKVTNQVEKSLILIVEDDYELTSFLKYSFTNEYIVRTACNGRQAMEILKEIKPALIISDYMMPEMKGDELCTILKKDKRTTDIPIIMLTGCDETYEIFQSLNTVVDMFITKPFDIKLLRARIRYLLTNKKTVKEEVIKETSTEDKFILNIKIIIKQNIAEPNYNVTDICKTLNISRTSLYTKIKKSTGLSPNDFIRSQHLNYAAQLLKQHQYTVSEVIDLSGFNDPKYFREMFKKQFGVNPSVYMKEETK